MIMAPKANVVLHVLEDVCYWELTLKVTEDGYELLCPRCGEDGIYTYRIEFYNCTCCGEWFNDLGDPLGIPYDVKEELCKHWYGY